MLTLNANAVIEVQISPVTSRKTEKGDTVQYRDIAIKTKKETVKAETFELPHSDPDTGLMVDSLEQRLTAQKVKVTFIDNQKKKKK